MNPAMVVLLSCLSGLHAAGEAAPSPVRAIRYLERQFAKHGLAFDRTTSNKSTRSTDGTALEASHRAVWGEDPKSRLMEGLVLLSPDKRRGRGLLVWVKEAPRNVWTHRVVTAVTFTPQSSWRIWALSAESLAQYQTTPRHGERQNSQLPPTPIEFHLEEFEDGPPTPAQVFHPKLGLAWVVNALQDDREEPAPPGQTWGTHARGESIDLPASAFGAAVFVIREKSRVWFRLGRDLFVADEGDWDSWVRAYGPTRGRGPTKS